MSDENQEWQAPPPPESGLIVAEKPQMSLLKTLTDIFFEPGKVFEDLRRKPFARLLFPLFFCSILLSGFSFALQEKIGSERIVREQLNSQFSELIPEEAKAKMKEDAKNITTAGILGRSAIGIPVILIIFAISGLIYWVGSLAMGGKGNYWHGLAVVGYSSFPQVLISVVGSLVILFLKNAEDISFAQAQGGLFKLSLGFLFDSNVLRAIVDRFDLIVIWSVFLSVIGLQKCFKTSAGGAWAIAIFMWLLGTGFAILGGMFS